MTDNTRVCVIVPAYNEAATIGTVLPKIQASLPCADLVVVDDGSHDETATIARASGAHVLQLPFNLGIGGAVGTGLRYAYEHNYDVALEIDADGQHDPKHAESLVMKLQASEADLVIGSRFIDDKSYRSSVMRRFGIHLFSYLIKVMTRRRIYDSTSGYRAYSRRALELIAKKYPLDFPEPESIMMLLFERAKIVEEPVVMKEREAGESVVKSDISLKALYFVASNAIAIVLLGLSLRSRPAGK